MKPFKENEMNHEYRVAASDIEALDTLDATKKAPARQQLAPGDHAYFPDSMSPKQFLELYYALDRKLVSAAILWQLIQMGAHHSSVWVSMRGLARALGNHVSKSSIHAGARRLEAEGLIEVACSRHGTRWFVCEDALREHLRWTSPAAWEPPGLDVEAPAPASCRSAGPYTESDRREPRSTCRRRGWGGSRI